MGSEDVFSALGQVADTVQSGIDNAKAKPTPIGGCNWALIVTGMFVTAMTFLGPLFAYLSVGRWRSGRSRRPWYALVQGYAATVAAALFLTLAGVVVIVQAIFGDAGSGGETTLSLILWGCSGLVSGSVLAWLLVGGLRYLRANRPVSDKEDWVALS